ncbi:MAG: Uncharacterised protein [Polaribacter sejongensis]|nr:MAG: Uncharacterised protein [Polaribacter sejongensis]
MFTLSNLLKRGANYFLIVLLARTIPVSVFGTYSAYINIIGVLLLVTNFGFSEYLLVNSENNRLLKINSSNFFQISILLFIIIFLGLCFLPTEDSTLAGLILIKIFLETSIYNILLAYYQVEKKINIMSITNIISGVSVIILSFSCYLLDSEIYTYFIFINLVYIVILIIHLLRAKFQIRSIIEIVSFIKTRFLDLKYYGISMITVPIYMMAPTVIGSFILEPEVLAQYQIAFSIANILLLVSVSLLQEGYVKFVSCKHNILELTKVLKKTGSKIILVNVFILVLFILFGKIILLTVYKQEAYLEAYYPLIILLFGNIIFMFAAIFAVTMVVLKLQKEKAKFHLEFILVSMFFGLLLTYIYGVYGLLSSYIILYSYSTIRYMFRFNEIYKSLTQKKKI